MRITALAICLLALTGCEAAHSPVEVKPALQSAVTGFDQSVEEGDALFQWLAPINVGVDPGETVDPDLLSLLTVRVCRLTGTGCVPVDSFDATGKGPAQLRVSEDLTHFHTVWSTKGLADSEYRIGVYVADTELGHAVMRVGERGRGLSDIIDINRGSSLPIKFWVGKYSVTVSPETCSIAVGGSQQLSASVEDAAGNVLTGYSAEWSSSDAALASVTSSGLVTGVAAGAATITATSVGKSATSAVTVTRTARFSQQGLKLVGTGAVGRAYQGQSVSLSADGNTAIVGGDSDVSGPQVGAAWVWTQSGGVWTQEGPKLVGSGSAGGAMQGRSVSLSADGNTAIVGGPSLDNNGGAAWVWTRNGGIWTQQGPKLVGSGAVGPALQGASVSISADGNTAIVGGEGDGGFRGAAWVWTRSGGVWTQQGPKLVGSGAVGTFVRQGRSVSLSADGNTAIVGGVDDNGRTGAAWVWTRTGGVWTQQGPKLVGSGTVGTSLQGHSVALSGDGNTAIVGGIYDNLATGAAWVWTRTGGVWTQQGPKLVGAGAVGESFQGHSVSLSADGNTAIVGGSLDNGGKGAAWVWRRTDGVWTQDEVKLVGSDALGTSRLGASVSLAADGNAAIVGGAGDNDWVGALWVFTTGGGCAATAAAVTPS